MKKLPQVSGLVLCDRVLFDTGTLEYTYSGVFHTLNLSFSDTPPHLLPRNQWPLRPFTVCGTLFNGDVEGRMELLVSHLEWEKATYRQRRWVSYRPGRLY